MRQSARTVQLGTAAGQALPGNDPSVTNARTPTIHASTHDIGGTDPLRLSVLPSAKGYVCESIPYLNATTTPNLVLATVNLVKILTGNGGTVGHADINLAVAGTSLTANQNFLGLFDSTGAALVRTAAGVMDGVLNQNTPQTVNLGNVVLPAGFVWAALLANGTGTTPALSGNNSLSAAFCNQNLTVPTSNMGTIPSGVNAFTVSAAGVNYQVGDQLPFSGGAGVGFQATVASLSGSGVATLTVASIGSGQAVNDVLTAGGGHGTGCQVTVNSLGVTGLTAQFQPSRITQAARMYYIGLKA